MMTDDPGLIEKRKSEHIQINLDQDVQAKGVATGLESYRFIHTALPEMDLNEIDTCVNFLNHHLDVPILISCMTGGVKSGLEINGRLATVAQSLGCAMGVGSQRAAIVNPAFEPLFQVRDVAPDILLLANLGAIQLNYGFGVDECHPVAAWMTPASRASALSASWRSMRYVLPLYRSPCNSRANASTFPIASLTGL